MPVISDLGLGDRSCGLALYGFVYVLLLSIRHSAERTPDMYNYVQDVGCNSVDGVNTIV